MASRDPPAATSAPSTQQLQPSQPPSQQTPPSEPTDAPLPTPTNPITHNAAIAMAILCPIALLLPARAGSGAARSTLQNAVLGAGGFWGLNQLAEDYTGKSVTARSAERWGALLGRSPAQTAGAGAGGVGDGDGSQHHSAELVDGLPTERAARNRMLMEAERRRRAAAEGREYKGKDHRGLLERIWYGGEREEGWKEKRLEEERKALESGKGYGGLIMDQVREVWNGKEGEGEGKKEEGGKAQGEEKKGE